VKPVEQTTPAQLVASGNKKAMISLGCGGLAFGLMVLYVVLTTDTSIYERTLIRFPVAAGEILFGICALIQGGKAHRCGSKKLLLVVSGMVLGGIVLAFAFVTLFIDLIALFVVYCIL